MAVVRLNGYPLTAVTARRLSCDAGLVEVRRGEEGEILDIGRKSRTVPPALRRALEARDRGCRFPGCGLRFTDAHHIVHWADGGDTSLTNTLLLCRAHHRRVHEDGWRVASDRTGERVVFFTPRGDPLFDAADPPRLPTDPVAVLVRRNRLRHVTPDAWTAAPEFNRDSDVPWSIEATAWEALERAGEEVEGVEVR